ncbi:MULTISPECIES: hypothetical protein [Thermocrispum]|uniref:hypothetical protein n=1 Tax=Thermocrispum TaxID=37924 RepID=UPI0012EB2C20|nr:MULTISPECIES: hypothetical protein [Thermocrispum]
MTRARWSTVATALLAALVVSGCQTPGTPAPTPPQPTTSTSTPAPPRDATNPVDVTFEDVTFTLRIPGYFGDGSLEEDDPECPAHRYTWGKLDKDSPWKRLTVAMVPAGGQACPDREAVNRRYPSWTSSEQLPERTQRVATPAGRGHQFTVGYLECTNECRSTSYTVIFVERGQGPFWLEAEELSRDELSAVTRSLRVS